MYNKNDKFSGQVNRMWAVVIIMLMITTVFGGIGTVQSVTEPTVDNILNLPEFETPKTEITNDIIEYDEEKSMFAPGEIIVKFKSDTNIDVTTDANLIAKTGVSSFDMLNEGYGVTNMEKVFKKSKIDDPFDFSQVYKLKLQEEDIPSIAEMYAADPNVEYAEPNYLAHTTHVPNDPRISEQWALENIQAFDGWDIQQGDPNVVIAVIDTGVDYLHEDLVDNIHPVMFDFVDINIPYYESYGYLTTPGEDYTIEDDDPMDFYGHGTHCAGIAAARGNNEIGISGVCPQASIMAIRAGFQIENQWGFGALFEEDDIAQSINFAVDNGADVISMSFGGPSLGSLIYEAIEYAHANGVILVASAGNSNSDVKNYPAGYDEVIAVGASAQDETKTYYSSYGSWVDVSAPGGDYYKDSMILSTIPTTGGLLSDPSGYRVMQGTSMAAPYVAGHAALLLSERPGLSADQVRDIIEYTGDKVDISKYEPLHRYIGPRINVSEALQQDDVPSPFALIKEDHYLGNVAGNVNVYGTAIGDLYVLKYTPVDTINWQTFDAGPQTINSVLGSLNVDDFPTGLYLIRLYARKGVLTDTDTVTFYVEKDYQDGWPHVMEKMKPFKSSAICMDIDEDGQNEIIQSSPGIPWFQDGYTYIWNEDGTDLPGWPNFFEVGPPTPSTSAVGDVDGDGDYEVVTTRYGGYIHAWHWQTGELLSGDWPKRIMNALCSNPVLADLDGDGDSEIIIVGGNYFDRYHGVWVFQHDGTLLWNYSMYFPFHLYDMGPSLIAPLAVADLDGDGNIEIIVSAYQDTFVLDNQGNLVREWSGGSHVSPLVANLDNVGELEIISVTDGTLRALHLNGDVVWEVPTENGLNRSATASVGDLDGDGYLEIFIASNVNNKVYRWDHLGNPITTGGFPKNIIRQDLSRLSEPDYQSVPTIGDIDGDGEKELMVGSTSGLLYAWNSDGTNVTTFPKYLADMYYPQYYSGGIYTTPTLGDLDVDGDIEIMVGLDNGKFHVWDLPGTYNADNIDWSMGRHDAQCSGLELKAPVLDPIPTPPTFIRVGETLQFQLSAYNPDNLPLYFYVRQMPAGASFDEPTRTFTWTPTPDQSHETFRIYPFLTDGIRQDHDPFTITVLNQSDIMITEPSDGGMVTGIVQIEGFAVDSDGVTNVEVKIDDGNWFIATGTDQWNYTWDTTIESIEWHTIYARVFNGMAYSSFDDVSVFVDPTELYVDDDFTGTEPDFGITQFKIIQNAVDNSTMGDIIWVASGSYIENVVIDKTITLIGEDRETTIIDGNLIDNVVQITADWVTISGFTIIRSPSNRVGLKLSNVQYCTIENNKITDNNNGISLWGKYNTIENNNILFNTVYGIGTAHGSDFNTIENNNISNNARYGLLWSSSYNTINNNYFSNNEQGIRITAHDGNIITNNIVTNNDYGIYLQSCDSTLIYHNDIIDNTNQAYDSTGTNFWNTSYPTGGNYWDDYSGTDLFSGPNQNQAGRDGIGDTPYSNFVGGGGAQDYYPLMPPNFLIPVIEGWNFISAPLEPLDASIPTVFTDLDGDTSWTILQYYDPTDSVDHWKTWANFKPPGLNDLTFIDHTMGVWLYIPAGSLGDGFIKVTGSQPSNTIINLEAGWNLVGYPAQDDSTYNIDDLISDTGGTAVTSVEGFNATAPYHLEVLTGDYVFKHGEAYWIKVDGDITWTVNW